MPLQITSTSSSPSSTSSNRISKKSSRKAFNKIIGRKKSNTTGSISSSFLRTKPNITSTSTSSSIQNGPKIRANTIVAAAKSPDFYSYHRIVLFSNNNPSKDVLSLISYILSRRFSPLPLSGGGFSKERIAELLRFRKNVPGFIPLPVLHAYSEDATECDREVDVLVRKGVLRRILIQGRGAMGEGVIKMEEYRSKVRNILGSKDDNIDLEFQQDLNEYDEKNTNEKETTESQNKDEEEQKVISEFLTYLSQNPTSTTYPSQSTIRKTEILLRHGFLSLLAPCTSSLDTDTNSNLAAKKLQSTYTSLSAISSSIMSQSYSPTTQFQLQQQQQQQPYAITLPNLGPFLRSLSTAKSILLEIISKTSPKTKLVPLEFLKERYHEPCEREIQEVGGELEGTGAVKEIPTDRIITRKGRSTILARTKKWNVKMGGFGLGMDFVLAELLGEGKVEIVKTGVGIAVKIR